MKELSIEQKAEAYDKFTEVLKEMFADKEVCGLDKSLLQKLFSELQENKESEDDVVIRALKSGFRLLEDEYNLKGLGGLKFEKILAWLEKQGEHANFRNKIQIGDKVTRNKDGVLVNLSQLQRVAKPAETYKQGEQKAIEYPLCNTVKDKIDYYIINHFTTDTVIKTDVNSIVKAMEEGIRIGMGEQKPTDNIEPKFKVGDWIIKDNYSAQQVKELREEAYILDGNISGVETLPKKYIENNYHLWTIQDAKDGDVLLSPATPKGDKECPFIFREIDEDGIVRFHAALLHSESFKIDDGLTNVMGYANAGYHIPASKKQRDLLFQKMKEAGYEWDADNKALKKIEQKPADKVEPKFKVGDWILCRNGKDTLYQVTESTSSGYKITNRDGSSHYVTFEQLVNCNATLCIVPNANTAEWSEEDKIRFKSTIIMLKEGAIHHFVKGEVQQNIDWLKSLKDRVQSRYLTVTDEELAQAKKDAYNDVLDKIEYNSENPTFDDGWSAAIWYLKKRISSNKQ